MIATFWQQMPFIRILFPFCMGIACAELSPLTTSKLLILQAFWAVLLFIFSVKIKKIRFEPIAGILVFLSLATLGICSVKLQQAKFFQDHYSKQKSTFLLATITQKPVIKDKNISMELAVFASLDSNKKIHYCKGNLALSLVKDSLANTLSYGDQILIKSCFQEISSPKNPNGFNYQKWMSRKGVYHQIWCNNTCWFKLNVNNGNFVLRQVYAAQDYISSILKVYLQGDEQIGIAEALLFGLDDHIPQEIIDAYSHTGTLHVLAVSGMHVGLIYLILGGLFKPLKSRKWAKWVEPWFMLIGIWLYSLLCGLSPSILRASVMFSFMIIGKLINRSGNPFNSLAASAFFLLFYDPQLLYHVGFQLSYAAVLGIIGFYPYLYLLYTPPFKWLDEIWKVIAVSLSAQLLTFPLSLYYFHQFPNYFLPANLILIPITTIIIYLGILLLIFQPFTWVSKILAWLIAQCISLANATAHTIASLPFANINQIPFTIAESICVYVLLILTVLYFKNRSLLHLQLALIFMASPLLYNAIILYKHQQQEQMVIYHSSKGLLISYTKSRATKFLTNSSFLTSKYFDRTIKEQSLFYRSKLLSIDSFPSANFRFCLNQTQIYVLEHTPKEKCSKASILVLCGKNWFNLEPLLTIEKPKLIILANNIPPKKREAIKKLCGKHKVRFYDIASAGAFVINAKEWKNL